MPELDTLGIPIARAAKPVLYRYIAGEDVSALRVVRYAEGTHRVLYARPPEVEARCPLGVTVTGVLAGEEVTVRRDGELTDGSWTWTPGAPVLLGAAGALTQTQPPSQPYLVVIGIAITATTIVINISPALVTA